MRSDCGIGLLLVFMGLSIPGAWAVQDLGPVRTLMGKPTSYQLSVRAEAVSWIGKSPCAANVRETLKTWGATHEWERQPSDLDGGRIYLSPTGRVGSWVSLASYPDGTLESRKISGDSIIRVVWNKSNCALSEEVKTAERERKTPQKKSKDLLLTDRDLQTWIDRKDSALIYEWSPHMPLSIRGFAEARGVAKKFALKFVPVLDPRADRKAAEHEVQANQLPPEALRRDATFELTARGMNLHYPSVLIVSKQQFSMRHPGLWETRDVLERFVKRYIQ